MSDKGHVVVLTVAEINHVYAVLVEAQAGGDYYGNRGQYYTRHQRILDKLVAALPDSVCEKTAHK